MKLSVQRFKEEGVKILHNLGVSKVNARTVIDALVESNMKGVDSHGIGYLPKYIRSITKSNNSISYTSSLNNDNYSQKDKEYLNKQGININLTEPEIVSSFHGNVVLDAKGGFGQVIGRRAVEIGVNKAKEYGVCAVSLRNAHHLGRIGGYAEYASELGAVSMHFVNVSGHDPLVSPYQGLDGRLGTNPIALGIPTVFDQDNDKSFIFSDFATSKIALGRAREAMAAGKQTENECLIDSKGNPTNDPSVMFPKPQQKRGALLPFAKHKGYALAAMCELFATSVVGGVSIATDTNPNNDMIYNSMLSVFIIPADSKKVQQKRTTEVVKYIQESPTRLNEAKRVKMPGESECIKLKENETSITVPKGTWDDIVDAAKLANVSNNDLQKCLL